MVSRITATLTIAAGFHLERLVRYRSETAEGPTLPLRVELTDG